jgi:predicted dehydrogenase
MTDNHPADNPRSSRRDFLKTAAVGTTALAANLSLLSNVHAAGGDTIKVGIIGCGGRGTGAIDNVLSSAPGVKLVAMGDAFGDHLNACYNNRDVRKHADQIDVPPERRFIGLDAYQKVLGCDINYVILATPPGFRPLHLEAAIAAGKHIFTEKPVGVDGAGIRRVLAAYEEAKKKNLCIVAGTQRRHQTGYLEAMKHVHEGDVGDLTAGRCYWNGNYVWEPNARQPKWGDLETQLRNWYYYTWLCGDHIVEQHVHNLDVINWALGSHPVKAVGMGGRANRTDPRYGHIYDHFAVDYEYPHGVHVLSMCRQVPQGSGCQTDISEALVGSKGFCNFGPYQITGLKGEKLWGFSNRKDNEPYVQEHTDLIEHIRSGQPINELRNVAESTLTAIMGRMSAYTGKLVTWDKALHTKEDLMPHNLAWDMSLPEPTVAVPGKTELI